MGYPNFNDPLENYRPSIHDTVRHEFSPLPELDTKDNYIAQLSERYGYLDGRNSILEDQRMRDQQTIMTLLEEIKSKETNIVELSEEINDIRNSWTKCRQTLRETEDERVKLQEIIDKSKTKVALKLATTRKK